LQKTKYFFGHVCFFLGTEAFPLISLPPLAKSLLSHMCLVLGGAEQEVGVPTVTSRNKERMGAKNTCISHSVVDPNPKESEGFGRIGIRKKV
jgi:hypothetical protein